MRYSLTAAAFFILGSLELSALGQSQIDPTQGLKHVGETVRVRMSVMSIGRAGEQLVLHSRDSWKVEDCFIIRLDTDAQAAYKKMGIQLPGVFIRKQIEVTGLVQTIKPGGLTRPVIFVSSPASIRILGPPKPTASSGGKPVEIKPEQGLQYVGKTVRVRLTVSSIGRGGESHNLNSARSWDAAGNLQVRLNPDVRAEYAMQGIENPGLHFLRKEIEVTGIVREIRPGGMRVPAIDLKSSDDLRSVLQSTRKAPAISELVNRRIELHLRDGKRFGNVLVTALSTGTVPESVSDLKVQIGDAGPRLYKAAAIEDIVADGVPLDLGYDRKNRVLFVDEEKRKARLKDAEETERRVLSLGKRLWPRLSDEEHSAWLEKHKEFAQSVQAHFPQLPLRVVETKFYVIVTDLPAAEARKYLGYLDTLYDTMCRAFGIPLGSNIWCGKCVVVAFQNRADFIRFEIEVMKNTKGNPTKSGGICHADGHGRVVISLFKGDFTARFATVLVHETSHGIVARFLSDIRIPSWLNEGMAVWIAKYVVKEDDTLEKSQKRSVETLRQQPTLAGFFDAPQVTGEYYGSGSAMVDLLLRRDSVAFRQFFTDIKQGYSQEEALQRAYRMTFADLARLYGRRIGLPNLQP